MRNLATVLLALSLSACADSEENRPATVEELKAHALSKLTVEQVRDIRNGSEKSFADAEAAFQAELKKKREVDSMALYERTRKCADFAFAEKNNAYCYTSGQRLGSDEARPHGTIESFYLHNLLGKCYFFGKTPSIRDARKNGCLAPKQ
jgi:hypothetical protein